MTNQVTTRCPNCFAAGLDANCKFCGWQPGLGNPSPALAHGVVLDGRYRIGRVLGHGGFGITYLAWDDNLHLQLAIKEYLPRDSATRAPDRMSLAIFSGAAEEQFAYGLDRFLEEARSLARYDQHPGIVTVKNFFRAHGTGYCVMEYVEGITLRRYLEQQPGGRISVADALKLLMPVADALKAVHKEGLLHRDIAPDNIYLTQDGRVKLLDFGAARFAAGEHSKSLSVILKPGYAPEEQYRTRGKQGPWTDVYGLGATLYRAITGQVPPDSLDRLDQDELVPPSALGVVIQPAQEAHLLKALAVKAERRWQNMEQLQEGWRSGNASLLPLVRKLAGEAPKSIPDVQPSQISNQSKSQTCFWSDANTDNTHIEVSEKKNTKDKRSELEVLGNILLGAFFLLSMLQLEAKYFGFTERIDTNLIALAFKSIFLIFIYFAVIVKSCKQGKIIWTKIAIAIHAIVLIIVYFIMDDLMDHWLYNWADYGVIILDFVAIGIMLRIYYLIKTKPWAFFVD